MLLLILTSFLGLVVSSVLGVCPAHVAEVYRQGNTVLMRGGTPVDKTTRILNGNEFTTCLGRSARQSGPFFLVDVDLLKTFRARDMVTLKEEVEFYKANADKGAVLYYETLGPCQGPVVNTAAKKAATEFELVADEFKASTTSWPTYAMCLMNFPGSTADAYLDFSDPSFANTRYFMAKTFNNWFPLHSRILDLDQHINENCARLKTPNSRNLPCVLYLHCQAGSDRTGQMAVAYRMYKERKPLQELLKWSNGIAGCPGGEHTNALQWYCFFLKIQRDGYTSTRFPDECMLPPECTFVVESDDVKLAAEPHFLADNNL